MENHEPKVRKGPFKITAALSDFMRLESAGGVLLLCTAILAFEHSGGENYTGDKLGILLASVLAAFAALFVLHKTLPAKRTAMQPGDG